MNYLDWDEDDDYDTRPVKIKTNKPKNGNQYSGKKDVRREARKFKEKNREKWLEDE